MRKNVRSKTKEETLARTIEIAKYIVASGATIRQAAKRFRVSKSCVHTNIQNVLSQENITLYEEVRKVLDKNKSERHIRGGMATKRKYGKTIIG